MPINCFYPPVEVLMLLELLLSILKFPLRHHSFEVFKTANSIDSSGNVFGKEFSAAIPELPVYCLKLKPPNCDLEKRLPGGRWDHEA